MTARNDAHRPGAKAGSPSRSRQADSRHGRQGPAAPAPEPVGPDDRAAWADASASWGAERFLREVPDWVDVLRRDEPIDELRRALLKRIDDISVHDDDQLADLHVLDRIVVRDCGRALRSMFAPRNERATGFSVLQAMVDAARGVPRPDLAPAFWADVCHIVHGLHGRAKLHAADSLEVDDRLTGRAAAQVRSQQLDWLGASVDVRCARYADGLSPDAVARRAARRDRILAALGGTRRDWNDWHWHLRHIARDAEGLARIAALSPDEAARVARAGRLAMPFGVTPYYASLFDDDTQAGRDRAIRAQVLPPDDYLDALGASDGIGDYMREGDTSPIDLVTRRYAEIVILKPYNACPQICVYCQRNWEIQGPMAEGALAPASQVGAALDWLAEHPTIHDVLVTGGDPMVLSDARLKALLDRLAAIPHVERIRIGTRMPVTAPMRFTARTAALLGSYRVPGRREVCVVTHVEHPYEVAPETARAVDRLRRQGISVYNQLVYTFFVSRRFEAVALRRVLRRCGIDPYYTFNTKGKDETAAYRVPIARLVQEQKEEARLLSGLTRTDEAVFNVPGLGKNHLNAWQHRDLVSVLPDGSRAYEFHPWEKKIAPQRTYITRDVPILGYLDRLAAIGEDVSEYQGIWYYF
ncbi:MAG TPA: KamA family radical SAM protein [Myxococcota bacterium]|nr:KamA family radical SAM protein [Myxococcota bacterium]